MRAPVLPGRECNAALRFALGSQGVLKTRSMADGHPHLPARNSSAAGMARNASELAGAMTCVKAYQHSMQHRYVSEDSWWQGFATVFMELEGKLRDPIALEIAVDALLSGQGSTTWSIQRLRMAL